MEEYIDMAVCLATWMGKKRLDCIVVLCNCNSAGVLHCANCALQLFWYRVVKIIVHCNYHVQQAGVSCDKKFA